MYEYRAVVVRVVDGDTIDVDIDLGLGVWKHKERLRLAGLNAPETSTQAGKDARDYLRGVLPVGAEVVVQTIKDSTEKYGRYLATVLIVGSAGSVNQLLIETAHAVPYSGGAR